MVSAGALPVLFKLVDAKYQMPEDWWDDGSEAAKKDVGDDSSSSDDDDDGGGGGNGSNKGHRTYKKKGPKQQQEVSQLALTPRQEESKLEAEIRDTLAIINDDR